MIVTIPGRGVTLVALAKLLLSMLTVWLFAIGIILMMLFYRKPESDSAAYLFWLMVSVLFSLLPWVAVWMEWRQTTFDEEILTFADEALTKTLRLKGLGDCVRTFPTSNVTRFLTHIRGNSRWLGFVDPDYDDERCVTIGRYLTDEEKRWLVEELNRILRIYQRDSDGKERSFGHNPNRHNRRGRHGESPCAGDIAAEGCAHYGDVRSERGSVGAAGSDVGKVGEAGKEICER